MLEARREQCRPVFLALALSNDDLTVVEVEVLCPLKVCDRFPVSSEHAPVEKEKCAQCLVLGGGCEMAVRSEVRQIRSHLLFVQVLRMCGIVVLDVSYDPAGVRLLRAIAIALPMTTGSDTIEERGRRRRVGRWHDRLIAGEGQATELDREPASL